MPNCTVENWKMKDIVVALSKQQYNDKKIVIPRFQRGKRWSDKQELTFIDSLKRGYPVGTLLFYRTNEIEGNIPIEVYTLVDGLQRSTAIKRYIDNPMKYYEIESVPEEMLTDVYDILGFQSQETTIKNKIKELYFDYVRNLKSFEGEFTFPLAKIISTEICSMKDKMEVMTQLMDVLPKYLNMCKQTYEIIANTEIPAVVYTGPEEELSEIFNRINSKGTPLNPFEIYAASWPQKDKYEIYNDEIIDHVLKKYDILNDDIYTVKGYDRSEISKLKQLTIFEYVFGLSKWLNKKYKFLAFEKNDKPDEISTIAFELLDACIYDSKNIGELHKILRNININKFEKRLIEAIEYVEAIITPITKFKGNKRKNDDALLYAKNQILSMIAYVFREKYDINDLKHEKDDWKLKEKDLRRQLYLHFVYEIIRKYWFEGGAKIHTAINSKLYNDEITPSAWDTALNAMFEDSFNRKEIKKVQNPSNVDIVFLNAIYGAKFSALDQLSTEHFDVEHIATKDIMKNLIGITCPEDALEGLPVSCIANLCYLPEHQNRAKGNKTFYQDISYLNGLSLEEIEEKYSFTHSEDLSWIELEYELGDFNVLQEFYFDFLKERFKIQKSNFYKAMNIDETNIRTTIDKSSTAKPKITQKSITESKAGQEKQIIYNRIKNKLENLYDENMWYESRTVLLGNNKRFILAYSKLYMQGKRHKYWFAYHPEKVRLSQNEESYYIFNCKDDDVSLSIPIKVLEDNCKFLNSSQNGDKTHYHIVIFVDIDENGNKKTSWLLSKPELKEKDVSIYKL